MSTDFRLFFIKTVLVLVLINDIRSQSGGELCDDITGGHGGGDEGIVDMLYKLLEWS